MKDIISHANNNNYKIIADDKILICDIELNNDEFELKLVPKKFDSTKYHIPFTN